MGNFSDISMLARVFLNHTKPWIVQYRGGGGVSQYGKWKLGGQNKLKVKIGWVKTSGKWKLGG